MWNVLIPSAIAGLSAVAGATFGGTKKEEESFSYDYDYTSNIQYSPQYTETTTYSPQYTITYQPVITIQSPNTTAYPSVGTTQQVEPFTTSTMEPNIQQPISKKEISERKEGITGEDTKPLIFAGLLAFGIYALTKK